MIERFEIVTEGSQRPDAERVIFCDGTGGDLFRTGADLELSHWRPNRTPREFRAGTSTEICFRFLDHPLPGSWTVAVNNHVDIDGILSVYVLVESHHALAHRETIVQAAEMGDFWGWGDTAAQRLFQGVTRFMKLGEGREIYETAFRRIPGLIDGTDPEIPEIDSSLAPLKLGVEQVEGHEIARTLLGDRLAHYIVPLSIAGEDDRRASFVPEFNEAISSRGILWPQVRACRDAERICLVSIERSAGWFYELWFPGYLWADTENFWQVPGMQYHDGMGSYSFDHPGLVSAFESLQSQDMGVGTWRLGGTRLQGNPKFQRNFPLMGKYCDGAGAAAVSSLVPSLVARELQRAFC